MPNLNSQIPNVWSLVLDSFGACLSLGAWDLVLQGFFIPHPSPGGWSPSGVCW
jgi:hypothetical protein